MKHMKIILVFLLLATTFCSIYALKVTNKSCSKICLGGNISSPYSPEFAHCYKKCVKKMEKGAKVLSDIALQERAEVSDETELSDLSTGASLQTTTASNIRSGPCTSNRIVRTVSTGTEVTFTGQTKSGCGYTWYSVRGSFGTGWIASSLVTQKGSSPGRRPSPGGASSGSFTADTLKRVFPLLASGKAQQYFPHLKRAMDGAGITSCLRRSAFLAQLGHESGQLRWFEEFASGAAYEGRRDLGNIYPGDGRRYKGRGPIQLTGRSNYRAAGKALGVDLEQHPTLAATPEWGFKIATWFWNTRGLSQYADQGSQSGFDVITRRINGGYNGKADRDRYWRQFKSILGC